MTSRDFGIVTLRNAVAYHFDGSIVPINNVYITSTNGGAVFSDTLTISTINVSTINGLPYAPSDDVFWSSTSSNGSIVNDNTGSVQINTFLQCSTITDVSTINGLPYPPQDDAFWSSTLSGGGIVNTNTGIVNINSTLSVSSIVNVQQISTFALAAASTISTASSYFIDYTVAIGSALPYANYPVLRFNSLKTDSGIQNKSLILTMGDGNPTWTSRLETSVVTDITNICDKFYISSNSTITQQFFTSTINVTSTFYDNNNSSGTAGQVLTAGTGGQVVWSSTLNVLSISTTSISATSISASSLNATGDIYATGNITAGSDIRFKTAINTLENSLSTVKYLRGVSYTTIDTQRKNIGVIAQEIEQFLPEVVLTDTTENQFKSVAYGNIVGILIEAIKELSDRVDNLEKLIRTT